MTSIPSSLLASLEAALARASDEPGLQISARVASPLVISGTAGNDVKTGTSKSEMLVGLAGHDRLSGAGGDDIIFGGTGNDTLLGGAGGDILDGGAGNDVFNGGTGYDTVNFTGKTAARVDLSITKAQKTGYGTDTFISIENLIGGSGKDVLKGNSAANALLGSAGNDTLYGAGGKDVLTGGLGSDKLDGGTGNDSLHGAQGIDILTGGAGRDSFLFDIGVKEKRADTITDFSVADDTMYLDRLYFTAFKKAGTLAASAFHIGATAHDADDRIVYNDATGAVYYDADGTGSAAPILFAKIGVGLALTNADFIVA